MEIIKSCIVTLFGKPNVGKSTIFNALQNNVYAIATKKPQTTRNNLVAKVKLSNEQYLILIDTPGFHKTNNKLDLFLNSEVKTALKQASIACFIYDPTRTINDEDLEILRYFDKLNSIIKVLIVNKIDLIKNPDDVDVDINNLKNEFQFDHVFKISAFNKQHLETLKSFFISELKPHDINLDMFIEPDDKFVIKEIIRETCLENLNHEVPHAISVMINDFKYDQTKNTLDIDASIYCEKESQKGIIVGKQGAMIKKLGTITRHKLLDIYDCKVNLKLYVKTKADWRNHDDLIIHMGYKK